MKIIKKLKARQFARQIELNKKTRPVKVKDKRIFVVIDEGAWFFSANQTTNPSWPDLAKTLIG